MLVFMWFTHETTPGIILLCIIYGLYTDNLQLIVDVIHRDMEFHPVLMAFIDTPQLQRLRHIKQLGQLQQLNKGFIAN